TANGSTPITDVLNGMCLCATASGNLPRAMSTSKLRERGRHMYLSKVLVERRRVHNPYELHRALWTMFPGHEHDTRGFLFRVEAERPGSATELLLQSAWQPEPQSAEVRVIATRPYQLHLRQGQALRFRLTGNPIKTIKDDTGRQNTRG